MTPTRLASRAWPPGAAALLGAALALASPAATASGSAPAAAKVPACVARPGLVCVERTDSGHTYSLRAGGRLELTLNGGGLTWSAPHAGVPALLHELSLPIADGAGWRVTYQAEGRGRAAIEATGRPICQVGMACPDFILLWQVFVTVTG